MDLIRSIDLVKLFRRGTEEIRALDGVSLTVQHGEFISITGASGSGKSTLLYIFGLLDSPTRGSYFLDGHSTAELRDDTRAELRNRMLGFIFQSFHLMPRADALRNVAMPLVYAGSYQEPLPAKLMNARAAAALERVGLADRMHHKPNELSGGQRQRVAIARALVNDPRMILADEPTGNLDSRNGREILHLFQQLNDQGVTILMVTHDNEIASAARRRIHMRDGKVETDHAIR